MTERLWGVKDVARFFGVPVATVYQWRYHGYGPQGHRVGRYVLYDPADVRGWFKSRGESIEKTR